MTTKNLLVELFVEELPPKALKKLGQAFAATLTHSLRSAGLCSDRAVMTVFASPRRLGVHLTEVLDKAADQAVQHKLMPVAVGLTGDGQPTPALLKKLKALGADDSVVSRLKQAPDGKAQALFLDSMVSGATLSTGLQKALDEALSKLPIPKVMTYQLESGEGVVPGWTSVSFVRPAHGLVALHGDQVVPVSVLGLTSGRSTQGHRFEAKTPVIELANADTYAAALRNEGAVIASFEERREEIVRQLHEAAQRAGAGLTPVSDEDLLDEVAGLVEWPNVLIGRFEPAFLEVPQECLILTMKANQKYFPLLDAAGKLSHQFLIVSNIRPADPSLVIQGNERVVRPRLADAKFFYDQDRKKTLESRVPGLDKVVYHNLLGTQGERVQRVRAIAQTIAKKLGDDALVQDAGLAAHVAKADLLTDMVGEFPELQGIMGRYYALHDGLGNTIAVAIEDHYKPRFAGDELPRNSVGLVLALADKLETLVGLFGIGQIPTGDKDPFALRRHALGVIRMLIERELPLGLDELIHIGQAALGARARTQVHDTLRVFFEERLATMLRDGGYSAQEVDAVLALKPQRLADIPKRLAAVRAFAALAESESLAAANKRVSNILKKAEAPVKPAVQTALLKEPAEIALDQALATVKPRADAAFDQGDYTSSLKALAALKVPVDTFFDQVMVNAEDPALRANRLGLLATLQASMNRVADLSKLAS